VTRLDNPGAHKCNFQNKTFVYITAVIVKNEITNIFTPSHLVTFYSTKAYAVTKYLIPPCRHFMDEPNRIKILQWWNTFDAKIFKYWREISRTVPKLAIVVKIGRMNFWSDPKRTLTWDQFHKPSNLLKSFTA